MPQVLDPKLVRKNLSELKLGYRPGLKNSEVLEFLEAIAVMNRKSSKRYEMRITWSSQFQVSCKPDR